jgi:hypothetical protein
MNSCDDGGAGASEPTAVELGACAGSACANDGPEAMHKSTKTDIADPLCRGVITVIMLIIPGYSFFSRDP